MILSSTCSSRVDLWLNSFFITNGILIYATWTTIATLLNFSSVLTYFADVEERVASIICLSILTAELVLYFVVDIFLLERHLRSAFMVYPVVIWASTAVLVNNWDPDSSTSIFTAVIVALACAAFVGKQIKGVWYCCCRKDQSTVADSDKMALQDVAWVIDRHFGISKQLTVSLAFERRLWLIFEKVHWEICFHFIFFRSLLMNVNVYKKKLYFEVANFTSYLSAIGLYRRYVREQSNNDRPSLNMQCTLRIIGSAFISICFQDRPFFFFRNMDVCIQMKVPNTWASLLSPPPPLKLFCWKSWRPARSGYCKICLHMFTFLLLIFVIDKLIYL